MKNLLFLLLLFLCQWPHAYGQQTKSEGQQSTANREQPTAKSQQPTANGQQSKANGQWSMIKGNASYYSDKLHGRRMANGEPYDKEGMTCAHLKFPFGTMLKVRNPLNDRTVIVRVTDRGPYSRRFIIDLSRAAARELGIIKAGFSMVEITPYHEGKVPYRAEEEEDSLLEIPELDLQYTPAATYPDPIWQRDSTQTEPEEE